MKHEHNGEADSGSPGAKNPVLGLRVMGSGRTSVTLELRCQGRDLLLQVTGGKAHVGAVAVWDGGASVDRTMVTELPGHREGPLAGECAEILGRASGRTVVAVVGIHQDHATPGEIDAIVEGARRGAAEMAAYLTENQRNPDD